MPVSYLYTENTFAEWRTVFNRLGANVGNLDNLDTPATDLVSAINALALASSTAADTDAVPEGVINLYFSNARARAAIGSNDPRIIYNKTTGNLSLDFELVTGVSSVNEEVGDVVLTTEDIPEGGGNLYFTETNWNDRLSITYTSNIQEGPAGLANTDVGNVYFTNARARAAFAAGQYIDLDSNGNISANIFAGTNMVIDANGMISTTLVIEGGGNVDSVNGYDGVVNLDTDDVPEGSANLYFTNARARAAFSVNGAGSYDAANGIVTIASAFGYEYRRFFFTLGSSRNYISGTDDQGHTLIIDSANVVDVYVNGLKLQANVDYFPNAAFTSSNVYFSVTLPAGTEIATQELTGNSAFSAGYVTEYKQDYVEPLTAVPESATVTLDLAHGQNTAFLVNVDQNITVTFSNPPIIANKIFIFTVFYRFGQTNTGGYNIVYSNSANIGWDGGLQPAMSINPSVLEGVTFMTLDGGGTYYGFKNLSNAPLV